MPKFLSKAEVYRLLQRELPEDVYADGAASAFFSTADHGAAASAIATLYANQERIYLNYFPFTADEKIGDHEVMYFGQISQEPLTLAQRRTAVVNKLREQPTLNKFDIRAAVRTLLADNTIDIFEWWEMTEENWQLDVSQLGYDTYLGDLEHFNPGLDFNYCSGSIPDQDRAVAFTYEVRIYGYALTATQAADLETLLLRREPARSAHFVIDNIPVESPLETEDGNTITTEDEVVIDT